MRRPMLVLALVLSVLSIATPAHAGPLIRGSGVRWTPARVVVDRGTTVRWKAVGGTHHLRAFGGNWTFDRALPAGTTVRRRFGKTGTFRFYCTIHATISQGRCTGMCGRVRVGTSGRDRRPPAPASASDPALARASRPEIPD
jgi:plastocyanin